MNEYKKVASRASNARQDWGSRIASMKMNSGGSEYICSGRGSICHEIARKQENILEAELG